MFSARGPKKALDICTQIVYATDTICSIVLWHLDHFTFRADEYSFGRMVSLRAEAERTRCATLARRMPKPPGEILAFYGVSPLGLGQR
jgi:hypothetical protein